MRECGGGGGFEFCKEKYDGKNIETYIPSVGYIFLYWGGGGGGGKAQASLPKKPYSQPPPHI